jgi:hypothetical protein
MADKQAKTKWHQLFAYLLTELLVPLDLIVQTEQGVSVDPPKIDVVIIKKEDKEWTPAQLEVLPDAIRDSTAEHILLEFKYTESFNLRAIRQILGYETFYQEGKDYIVQSFLVISKTPRKFNLILYGYHSTEQAGVYESSNILLKDIKMLVLNELSNEPHNVYFKLFASRKSVKQEAVRVIRQKKRWARLTETVRTFLQNLLAIWFIAKGDEKMIEEILKLKPESSGRIKQAFKKYYLPDMPLEERLEGISLEELLEGISLEGLPDEKLLKVPHIDQIHEQGIEQGIEQGERKAKIEAITQILTTRFPIKLGQLEEQLTKLDLKTLTELTETALTVEDLTLFEEVLTEVLAKASANTLADEQNKLDKQNVTTSKKFGV